MNRSTFRVASGCMLALALAACPPVVSAPDADGDDFDAGNPAARAACSGGCAANQVCDTAKRICVDACGGCDGGTCVKLSEGVYQCRSPVATCGNTVCEAGQVACLGGECSCLSSLSGALDSCRAVGKWCNGRTCEAPKAFQQCQAGALAACPTGHSCQPIFGADSRVCVKNCTDSLGCDKGDVCYQNQVCLPTGILGSGECNQTRFNADGGYDVDDAGVPLRLTVPVANTCLLKDAEGTPTEIGLGSGNCTYAIFQLWDQGNIPVETCRPPGGATEGQACKDDFSEGAFATRCATGLHCAKTKGGNEGVCLRMCNAQPSVLGYPSQPECGTSEACVNLLRYTDPNTNSVLGVCMKKCDVFDTVANACANVGSTATSCVPTEASGELVLSRTGEGICVPQRASIAAVGQRCDETDAFRGAACGAAQLCTSLDVNAPAACTAVCDLECNPADGGAGPARCATEPNARCRTGTSCRRVSSGTGARVGFCL